MFSRRPEEKPVSRKDTNPKDRAATGKLDLSLVPDTAVIGMALAFTEGGFKYGAYNWRVAGARASVYVAALRRHVARWMDGEASDPETGVPHLASAMACLAVLFDAESMGMLTDDRPPHGTASAMLKVSERLVAQLQTAYPTPPARNTITTRKRHGRSKLVPPVRGAASTGG